MNNLRHKVEIFLKKLEPYTKTDMVYLTKGSFWLNISQGFSSLSSFLLAIAFANLVPKEVYGDYKYVLSVAAIITGFRLTGIGVAVTQSVARGYDATLLKAFYVNLKWSIFMVIGFIGTGVYYLFQHNYILAISLFSISFIIPFLKSFELYSAYLEGKKNFKESSYFDAAKDIFTAVLIFLTIFLTKNVIIIVFVYFSSYLLGNAYIYTRVVRHITDKTKIDFHTFKFSKHLSAINLLNNLYAQVDKIIVYHFLGPVDLAVYTFAVAIPKQIRSFLTPLGTLSLPKFSERPVYEIVQSVPKKFFISLVLLVPVVVVYIFTAPYIYRLLFPQYTDAVIYSQVYALFLLLVGNMSENIIIAKKAVKEKYILNTTMSIFGLVSMLVLVEYYGIMGIIVSILLTKTITSIWAYTLVRKIRDL